MGTGSFQEVKRPGLGVDHAPPSSTEAEGTAELHICSPSGPSWPVIGWPLSLPFTFNLASVLCPSYHITKRTRRLVIWMRFRPQIRRPARRLFKLGPQQTLLSVTGQPPKSLQKGQNAVGLCAFRAFSTEDGNRSIFFSKCCILSRRFRVVEKSVCYLRVVPSFTHPHTSAQLPLDVFPRSLILGTFMNIFKKHQFWLKSERNMRHFTWRPKYILLLPAT
jgi:hypothetical protein